MEYLEAFFRSEISNSHIKCGKRIPEGFPVPY
jgi:hypothetical protein